MTKTELLLNVIGEAKDEYLEEIDYRVSQVDRRKRWKRAPLIAACVILIVGILLQIGPVFDNEPFLGAHGAANIPDGIAAGEYFYYEVSGDGFFRYTPEEGSVRLTRGGLFDCWFNRWYSFTANDYGFYYTKGNWIYRIKHGETESEKLYRYEGKVRNPYMYPAGANDIAVDVYYEGKNVGMHNELFIIDGITGDRKMTLIDEYVDQEEIDAIRRVLKNEEPGSDAYQQASDQLDSHTPAFAPKVTYTVGDRTLELVLEEGSDRFDYAYRLTENGKWLTDSYVEPYDVRAVGDSLMFTLGRDGTNIGCCGGGFLIVRPDGTQQSVKRAGTLGDEEYCFTYDYRYEDGEDFQIISAVRLSDSEQFELKRLGRDRGEWVNSIRFDGKVLYLTYYGRIACYEVGYEDGVPIALTLIDRNICEQ